MTTEKPADGSEGMHAAEAVDQEWAESTRNILDNYPYDAIQILVYIMNEYEEVEIYIRRDPLHPVKDETHTETVPQPRVATVHLPRGYLHEGAEYHVINGNSWEYMDPAFIELDARLAESFGLADLAAFTREWIPDGSTISRAERMLRTVSGPESFAMIPTELLASPSWNVEAD
jgi:hypothetical protein